MGARHKARKRALNFLYEAEQRSLEPMELLRDRLPEADPPVPEYTVQLVEGVVAHQRVIDDALSVYSQGWSLQRMPAVDRALLRIATYEIVWNDEVDDAVAIDEAVELAKELSTDNSPTFVNGLLARMMEVKGDLRF